MTTGRTAETLDPRLPLVSLMTWGSTLLTLGLRPPWWVWALTLLLSLAGATVSFHRAQLVNVGSGVRGSLALVAAGLALAALAGLSTTAHMHRREPPDDLENRSVQILLRVTHSATPSSSTLRGVMVEIDGEPAPGIPVMLTGVQPSGRWPLGTVLETTTRLRSLPALDARGWIGTAGDITVNAPAPPLVLGADSLREGLLRRSLAHGGDGGALLPGLSLGDTTGVSSSLEEAMRTSSLSHVVAVSGANVALVVGSVVGLVALLGGGMWWRVGAGLLALVGFVILVTPEASVVRASVMAAITLVAVVSGRPSRGIPALALTVWGLILFDPWRSLDLAFALSVAATGGILIGVKPLARRLEAFLPTPLAWLVALPLIAQVAVWPLLVWLRPTIPVGGVAANILATPAIALVTVLGVLGAILGPFVPWVADALVFIGWWPASWIAGLARTVSALPGAELPFFSGGVGVVLALIACSGVWLWLFGPWGATPLALFALVIFLGTSSILVPRVVTSWTLPPRWEIAQCDVGQGDALVIRSGEDTVVIDTGDDTRALEDCLSILGVSSLDYGVLTHFDRDHVGAVEVLSGRVSDVLSGPPENSHDRRVLDSLDQAGSSVTQVVEGDWIALGNHRLHILWPSSRPLTDPGNDQSVVVWLEPNATCPECLSLLALGDLGEEAQRHLLPRLPSGGVDVVKVSHHGSADQLPDLYRALQAPVAMIGVGAGNSYGHPTPSLLALLESVGSRIVRSDRDGLSVVWRGADNHLHLWSEGRR